MIEKFVITSPAKQYWIQFYEFLQNNIFWLLILGIKKSKTVFKMKSLTSGKEIDCIVWANSTCRIGDEIRVEGRLEKDNKAFIVWNDKKDNSPKILITKRASA